jgi:hypothetical protein
MKATRAAGLALLTTLMFFAGAEGLARLVYGSPRPMMGVERQDAYLHVDGDGVVVNHHLKDEAPVRVKRAVEQPRALFVGGSSVHQGVPPRPQEWPAVVGELLRADTVNLGSPGLDSNDLVQVVTEAEVLTHKVIVVYVGHNDFANAFMRARFAGGGSRALARLRVALMGLRLFTLLDDRFASRGAGRRQEEAGVPILSAGEKAEILSGLEANLHTIVETCGARGVNVVLVSPASSVLHPPAEQLCDTKRCLNDEFRRRPGPRASRSKGGCRGVPRRAGPRLVVDPRAERGGGGLPPGRPRDRGAARRGRGGLTPGGRREPARRAPVSGPASLLRGGAPGLGGAGGAGRR